LEHEIRTSLENFTTRLRSSIDGELDHLASELMEAVDAYAQRARADAESAAASREAQARAEGERHVREELERVRAAAAADAAESAARQQTDADTARVREREARLEAIERLLSSVRRLDAASSLRETLEVLVQSASLETPRVAVLLIEGTTVRSFAQRGFADVPDSGPLAAGGVIEACARHGQPAFTADSSGLKAPGFAGLAADRAGFAAPLRVGNRTVAVLYADDADGSGAEAPAAWPEALELLARHASIHLENQTALRAVQISSSSSSSSPFYQAEHDSAVQAESEPETELRTGTGTGTGPDDARRYARLLVSEIKLYNEASVRLGREHHDLRSRLESEITLAQRQYEERIPATVRDRDAYFEQELVETLGGGDPSTLTR
jgi:hypothetical protein